jgi:hypothetical protein
MWWVTIAGAGLWFIRNCITTFWQTCPTRTSVSILLLLYISSSTTHSKDIDVGISLVAGVRVKGGPLI